MTDGPEDNRTIDLHRARERLLEMIGTDSATFTMFVGQYQEEEYCDVLVEYEICGVHYEKDTGKLKLVINLNCVTPPGIGLDSGRVRELMAADIAENCRFLLKDTYYVSFDRESVRDVNRKARLKEFKQELEFLVRDRGYAMDDVLPMVLEFLEESLPESRWRTLEALQGAGGEKEKKAGMVLEITPPGVPCPHCNGLLSEKALRTLIERFWLRYRSRDERDH